MTADVVNLRLARKRRDRSEAAAEAAARRVKHGLTKEQKAIARAQQDVAQQYLDGHRLPPPPER